MYSEPRRTLSGSAGVSTSTAPILAALGQPAPGAEYAVSCRSCASVQTFSPSAREGLAEKPSGRVTTDFLMSVVATASTSGLSKPSLLTSRLKSRPVGLEAATVVGLAVIAGPKGSLPQPVVPIRAGGSELSWVSLKSVSQCGSARSGRPLGRYAPRSSQESVA